MMIKRWFNRLTLTQQWVTVTLLAVVPLLLALIYASWSLAQQSRQQSQLLASMDHLNTMDAFIQRQLASMERVSRQYMLIGDERFADLYRQRLTALADYRINLAVTLPSGLEHSKLTQLLELASQIGMELYRSPSSVDTEKVDRLWTQVNAGREELSELIDQFGTQSAARGERQQQQVNRRLALIGGGTVAITLLFISFSSVAITRPVRRLGGAIQRMGHQNWSEAVEIDGPKDFVALGNNLEWMRLQLLAADKQKQAFLQHITHELKTPLAAIVEAESLLRDQVPGPLTTSQFNVLGILRQNTRNLQSLIQQLLNYNAIKHSHALDLSPVDLRQLCEKICQQLEHAGGEKQVRWVFKGWRNTIPSDRHCLEMILSNLMSNAYHSVPARGLIKITWGHVKGSWWLKVTDNGPGIPAQERENIFKPFYQGKATRKGPLKGSGMGLAIVNECVLLLNGNIELQSEANRSTEFTLHFPMGDRQYHEAA